MSTEHTSLLTWFIQEAGSYLCFCTTKRLLSSSKLYSKISWWRSIANPALQYSSPSIHRLTFSIVPLFLFPHAAKQRGMTWHRNSEVLTVTGCILFCLGSPVRQDPLQTDKRDPWRAWHFHLALASLHRLAHSFQLTPALYVVSGAADGQCGLPELDESAWHSAGMRWHMQGWGLSGDGDRRVEGMHAHAQTENRDMRKTHTQRHPCLHTACAFHAWTHRQSGKDACKISHIFSFFSLQAKISVSSWEGIRMTCRMGVLVCLCTFACVCVCVYVCMGDPFCLLVWDCFCVSVPPVAPLT